MTVDCLQESDTRKEEWLHSAHTRTPIGARVQIIASDAMVYVGQMGIVVGYDVGTSGSRPGVRVRLNNGVVDLFYYDNTSDDELVVVDRFPVPPGRLTRE